MTFRGLPPSACGITEGTQLLCDWLLAQHSPSWLCASEDGKLLACLELKTATSRSVDDRLRLGVDMPVPQFPRW